MSSSMINVCEVCNESFARTFTYKRHLGRAKHLRNIEAVTTQTQCLNNNGSRKVLVDENEIKMLWYHAQQTDRHNRKPFA